MKPGKMGVLAQADCVEAGCTLRSKRPFAVIWQAFYGEIHDEDR
jgi:hypothetical protein